MLITSLPNELLRRSKIADQTPLLSNLPIRVSSPPPAGLSGRASLLRGSGCHPRRSKAGGVEGDEEDFSFSVGEEKLTEIFGSTRN